MNSEMITLIPMQRGKSNTNARPEPRRASTSLRSDPFSRVSALPA